MTLADLDIELIVRKYRHSLQSMAAELQKIVGDRRVSIVIEDKEPGYLYAQKIYHPGDIEAVS